MSLAHLAEQLNGNHPNSLSQQSLPPNPSTGWGNKNILGPTSNMSNQEEKYIFMSFLNSLNSEISSQRIGKAFQVEENMKIMKSGI